jgi:hypothetical protein
MTLELHWEALARRERLCWAMKGLSLAGAVGCFSSLDCGAPSAEQGFLWGAIALAVGAVGTNAAHVWLDRFRCPRCKHSFTQAGWTKPYIALLISPRRCVNCGLSRGAMTWRVR